MGLKWVKLLDDISIKLRMIADALPQKIYDALERSAQQVENTAKEECLVDTGILRASINHIVEENVAIIGTNVEYAPMVHEKFKPFLEQALNGNIQNIHDNFEGLLER